MSLCALIWSATAAQAIELDRPLMPQSALIWESEEAPQESLTMQEPVGTTWKKVELPSSGFVLQERSWLALSIDAPRPGQMMLTCSGHQSLFCNGVEHPMDPGALGAMMWPAPMREGKNWIFIEGKGTPLLTSFRPVSRNTSTSLHITQYDRTIPQATDLVETNALGAMVVTNLSAEPIENVNLWSRCTFIPNQKYVGRLYPEDWKPGEWTPGQSVTIPAWSMVKMQVHLKGPPPFKRDPQPYPFALEARIGSKVIASGSVNLAVREASDRTWHTYESKIDGSIQRWIHVPSTTAETKLQPALFVLPHVQQSPQNHALGFEPSPDHHIIVCWGRRPDREAYRTSIHLESILETIKEATLRHNIDPTQVGLLGFGDAGHTAFALQQLHPSAFTGIGVVSCFPPVDQLTGAKSPLSKLPGRLGMRWGSECASAPPDAQRRYEMVAQDQDLLIDIVPGEEEWWGRKSVDNPDFHKWILRGRGNLNTAHFRAVALEGEASHLWSKFDAGQTGL